MNPNKEQKIITTEETSEMNTEKIDKSHKQYTDRTKQALKYAIAMLTIVSFFTTSNGLSKLMTDSHALIPYLVSFGIQIFVLVIGTNLWAILKKNKKEPNICNTNHKHRLFSVFITAAYVFSVCFSSFFSYVFLSNSVYSKVKTQDYNIEIERFLNLETKNLKNINDIEGDLIKNTLRSYLPEIQNIYNIVSSTNINKNEQIQENLNLTKYTVSEISFAFSVDNTIESFADLNSFQIARLYDMRNALDSIESAYPAHYASYESIFNRINDNLLNEDIDLLLKEINVNKENINLLFKEVDNISDESHSGFNNALQQTKSNARIRLNGLLNAYDTLISVCERIQKNTSDNDIKIDEIRSLLYSVSDITEEDLENIQNSLNKLIVSYQDINNQNTQDEEIFSTVSDCITYLGEYKKYLDLKKSIETYEKTVLKQVYIISEEKKQEAGNNDSIKKVNSKEWNKDRREDLGEFISLLKSLPDTNTLLNLTENTNDKYKKILKEHSDYQEDTLKEAYLLSRNKLETISATETALLYMKSDFNTMAIFSLLMSLFIDITPFLVGTYMNFNTKEIKDKDKEEIKN